MGFSRRRWGGTPPQVTLVDWEAVPLDVRSRREVEWIDVGKAFSVSYSYDSLFLIRASVSSHWASRS